MQQRPLSCMTVTYYGLAQPEKAPRAKGMCFSLENFSCPMRYIQRAAQSPTRQWMKTSMCKEEPKCPFFSWLFSCFVMYSHATVWQLCSSPGISVEVGRTRNLEHTVWDVISKLYSLPPLPKYHQQFNTQVYLEPFLTIGTSFPLCPASPAWAISCKF